MRQTDCGLASICQILLDLLVLDTRKSAIELTQRWNEDEWLAAKITCHVLGISSLLYTLLKDEAALEKNFINFLGVEYESNTKRQERLSRLLSDFESSVKDDHIQMKLLKGSYLVRHIYSDKNIRPMADIDVLIKREIWPNLRSKLDSQGYVTIADFHNSATLMPLEDAKKITAPESGLYFDDPDVDYEIGESVDDPVSLDVHFELNKHLKFKLFDIDSVKDSFNDNSFALLHIVMHFSSNITSRTLRGIQLYDLVMISASLDEDDWESVIQFMRDTDNERFLYALLFLVDKYFGKGVWSHYLAELSCPKRIEYLLDKKGLWWFSCCNPYAMTITELLCWAGSIKEILATIRYFIVEQRKSVTAYTFHSETDTKKHQVDSLFKRLYRHFFVKKSRRTFMTFRSKGFDFSNV